jgi:prevent-host-death family protein
MDRNLVLSDNLIRMKNVSATEAGRHFSKLLDAVEHRRESFVVMRKGRSVARIIPEPGASGRAVKEFLRNHRVDAAWSKELQELRSLLEGEERWTG